VTVSPQRARSWRSTLAVAGLLLASAGAAPAEAGDEPAFAAHAPQISVPVGQSMLLPVWGKIRRVAVANENVVDYRQTGADQLYLLGKQVGITDLTIWYVSGQVQTFRIEAALDPMPLRQLIHAVSGQGAAVRILAAGSSFVLQGEVRDVPTADIILRVADAYAANLSEQLDRLGSGSGGGGQAAGGGQGSPASAQGDTKVPLVALINQTAAPGSNRAGEKAGAVGVINALSVRDGQQVMLEVRIAEVTRSLAERMGVSITSNDTSGSLSWRVGSAFVGSGAGTASLSFLGRGPDFKIDLDAERKAGRVKILAEPTISAMSGTEGSFLVGGSVFIPTPSSGSNGNAQAISLEEREFGVSLKFRPTVLADRNINLEISSEVSELSREGVSYQSGQSQAILPTLTKSKVATTVQLNEGQSLVIGGLLKNNTTETRKSLPLLGDIPILGALFRSSDYVYDRTELVVVVRPVFSTASDTAPRLPTDAASVGALPPGNPSGLPDVAPSAPSESGSDDETAAEP